MESKLKILMVSFVWIVIFAVLRYSSGFIKDLIFSLVILVILYFIYQKCKLTSITYSLVSLSLFIHNLGAFGFYSNPNLHGSLSFIGDRCRTEAGSAFYLGYSLVLELGRTRYDARLV